MDFFAGSGPAAHAVINLNRKDDGSRRYILVEQAYYFEDALKPRIQKIIYSRDWKDGKHVEGSQGSSHTFQYIRLESYEDALDNLEVQPVSPASQPTFMLDRDDYLLRYMLDHETREARLNIAAFATPFDYKITTQRSGVKTQTSVDLVETANFLLGLTVTSRRAYQHQDRTYRVVRGNTREDKLVVVIWRNTGSLDLKQEAAFIQKEILVDAEPDLIYVNGESLVPNAQAIENTFMTAMRGGED